MAFMQGWDFIFLHKQIDGNLILSANIMNNIHLASVDELFKSKDLKIEKTYFVAQEGVYSYSKMNKTWIKSR